MEVLKLLWYFTVLMCCTLPCSSKFLKDRKILTSKFSNSKTVGNSIDSIQKSIRSETLKNLHSLPLNVKIDLSNLADNALKGKYPVKTASGFMQVTRTGDRETYEDNYHEHRSRLSMLTVGQLLLEQGNNKTYINEIVDGVWMMMEDSAWCYPDHLGLQSAVGVLPVPGHVALDLNAGETAKLLAWIKLLLGDQFDRVSPVINQRIDYELQIRIFQNYLNVDNWWLSFDGDHDAVNWNVWMNSNVLKAALFTLKDGAQFDKILNRSLYSVDYFLDNYDEDGGCIEGPFYWRHASGRLIEYLESLEQIFGSEAQKYFSGNKMIKQMGEYPVKMRITDNWFVNFGDSFPQLIYPPAVLAKFGVLFDDIKMKQLSAYMFANLDKVPLATTAYGKLLSKDDLREVINLDLNEFFNVVNMRKEIESFQSTTESEDDLVWIPDIEVMTVRSGKNAKSKLFLATKAGYNNESHHNHNDIGHFILYQDSTPVIIDIGVGAYTHKYFTERRYEVFYTQSQYHNCPVINGFQQAAGSQYSANQTTLKVFLNNDGVHFQTDIAGAYPNTSLVHHWIRSLQFNRTINEIELDDQFKLDQFIQPQQLNFIVNPKVEIEKTNYGIHFNLDSKVNLQMSFDTKVFDIKIEEKSTEGDFRLRKFWGDNVKRLTLVTKPNYKQLEDRFNFRFSNGK